MNNNLLFRWGIPSCILLGVFTLFFYPVLFEGNTFFFRDINHFAYPMKFFLSKAWAIGEWPHWYPNLLQGIPLTPLMHPGVFYPPSVLFLLDDFLFAFNAYFLFHHLILMGSVYALCRYWGRSIPGSLCASLTALLGGYFLSLAAVYNQFQSAIWFPLILLMWQKFQTAGNWRYFCGAVVFLAFQVLGGGPENAIFSVLLVYSHSLYLIKGQEFRQGFNQKSLTILALVAVSLALSALQWVPTYHFLSEISRGNGLNYATSTHWSLEPRALLDLFLPEDFGHFLERDGGQANYFVHSFYMGVVPLFFLLGCLLIGRAQKAIRFWLVVFGVGVFFALGKYNPLYALFHEWVPVFNMFRYPQKFFFLCAYALLFLSAWALDLFVDLIINKKSETKKILLALLVTALIVAAMFGAHINRAGLISLVILGLLATAVLFLHLKKINPPVFCSLLLLLMVMDLMSKNAMLVPLIDGKFYTQSPPLAESLRGTADSFRTYNGMLIKRLVRKTNPVSAVVSKPRLSPSRRERPSFNLLAIQLATRDQVYPNLGAIYDLAYVDGFATMKLKSSYRWHESFLLSDIPKKKIILKRSNVKFWVTEDYQQLPSDQHPRGIKKVNVFEDALPRAFLVGGSQTLPAAKQLDLYYDAEFDPLKQVLLTEPVEIKKEVHFSGQVENIEYSPNRVTLNTSQNGEGFLVLLDTYFPGWQVSVDGQHQRIYQANSFYRAVKLKPGNHRIEFSYEPVGLKVGIGISGAALTLLIVGPLLLSFRNYRAERGVP